MALFGANSAATPSSNIFGAAATPATGAPASTPNLFAAAAAATPGGFGPAAQSTPATGAAGAFGLGAQPTPATGAAGAFGLGALSTPATGAAGAFGLGAQSTPATGAAGAFGLGVQSTPATGAAGAFGLGAQPTPATGAAGAFGFGAQSTPATGAAGAFGFGAVTSTPSAAVGASLFGSTPAAAPQPAPSMFGAPSAPHSAPSMFGAPAATPASTGMGLFGSATPAAGTGFGASAAAAPAPAAPATPKPITGESKVSDLPPHLQTELLAVERHLRDQRAKAERLLGRKASLSAQCKDLEMRYGAMAQKATRGKAALDLLSAHVETLRGATRVDHRATSAVLDALSAASSSSNPGGSALVPHGYGWGRLDSAASDRAAHVPPAYFARVVADLELRACEYKREIDEVADYFRAQGHRLAGGGPISRFGGARAAMPQPRARARSIEDVIRRQYDYFMVVATQVAVVHEALRGFKGQYVAALRVRDADSVDPFEQADLREKATKERRRYQAEQAMQRSLAGAGQTAQGMQAAGGMGGATPATGGSLFGGGFGASAQAGAGQSQISLFGGSGFGAGGAASTGSLFGGASGFGVTAGGETPGDGRRRKR